MLLDQASSMPGLEVEERQDSPFSRNIEMIFCCQFAAKISAILVLFSAFACISLHIASRRACIHAVSQHFQRSDPNGIRIDLF
jgi:hypothetical protein